MPRQLQQGIWRWARRHQHRAAPGRCRAAPAGAARGRRDALMPGKVKARAACEAGGGRHAHSERSRGQSGLLWLAETQWLQRPARRGSWPRASAAWRASLAQLARRAGSSCKCGPGRVSRGAGALERNSRLPTLAEEACPVSPVSANMPAAPAPARTANGASRAGPATAAVACATSASLGSWVLGQGLRGHPTPPHVTFAQLAFLTAAHALPNAGVRKKGPAGTVPLGPPGPQLPGTRDITPWCRAPGIEVSTVAARRSLGTRLDSAIGDSVAPQIGTATGRVQADNCDGRHAVPSAQLDSAPACRKVPVGLAGGAQCGPPAGWTLPRDA